MKKILATIIVILIIITIVILILVFSLANKDTGTNNNSTPDTNNTPNTSTSEDYNHVVAHIDSFFEKYRNLDEDAGEYLLNGGGSDAKMSYGEIQSLVAKTITYKITNIEKRKHSAYDYYFYTVNVSFKTIDVIRTLEGIVDIYAEGDMTDKQMAEFKSLIDSGDYVPLEIEGDVIVDEYGESLYIRMNNVLSRALTGGVSGYPF